MGLDRSLPEVYRPAEDTFLLAETASERTGEGDVVLDVGTGSGYVATTIEDETGACVLGSDCNPKACREAKEHGLSVVRGDLVSPFRSGRFDLVTFNPPYLPTRSENERDDWLGKALSGGPDGRRVIEPFLDGVARVLGTDGTVLLLVSSHSDIDAVREYARNAGFAVERAAETRVSFETLAVLELTAR